MMTSGQRKATALPVPPASPRPPAPGREGVRCRDCGKRSSGRNGVCAFCLSGYLEPVASPVDRHRDGQRLAIL
jgi:hypothetical protein